MEVPKLLAEDLLLTTHTIQLSNLLDATYPLVFSLKLQDVAGYFDACKPKKQHYEDENIATIHLMAEDLLWDPTNWKSCMINFRELVIIPALQQDKN